MNSVIKSFAPKDGADLSAYVGQAVKVEQQAGVAVVALYVDGTAARGTGIIQEVDPDTLWVSVVMSGECLFKPGASVTAGQALTANTAGADAAAKSKLVAAVADDFPLLIAAENGAADVPTTGIVNPSYVVLA